MAPPTVATASPAPIPPQDVPSKVLVAASSKPVTISIHAQMVFAEMPADRGAVLFARVVATMAHTSMSSSVSTSAHELLGELLSRYIIMLFATPMLDAVLLDCAATVHEVKRYQKLAELGSVKLWPSHIPQQGMFTYVLENDVDLWSPWPPSRSFFLQIEIQSVGDQLKPTPWPYFYCYAALLQWIKSLVVADDILPKPPWLAFYRTLFKVYCSCSNTCASLQYALQRLSDGGHIQSYQYISICRWPSTIQTAELLMIDFTWEEDQVLPLPPLKIRHGFSGVHSIDANGLIRHKFNWVAKHIAGNYPGQ
ncbi:hypothetical protein BDA96_07G193200 [Sorghum bicolor]|nr:hypothetical protein BDA96_07G193200 [Sorghum bicolor]